MGHSSFDQIEKTHLEQMAQATGPRLSVLMPVDRTDQQSRESSTRLKSLLGEAQRQLSAAGLDSNAIDARLEPFTALINDGPFWRNQGDGLALFSADDVHFVFRVGVPLDELVHVGEQFALRPLATALAESSKFYILALSRAKVRLFDATRDSVTELDLGDTVPASMDDLVSADEHQRQLQSRSVGGDRAMFHGHGAGDEADSVFVDKFLKAVGQGVGDLLGKARSRPMILAAVAEAHPAFKQFCTYPALQDAMVKGNPDDRSPKELHAAAWDAILPTFKAQDDAVFDRFSAKLGTGLSATQSDKIRDAAVEGRVDTLFINPGVTQNADGVNEAILATLQSSGKLIIMSDGSVDNVAALFRY